jgi:hypothetical protein
MTGLLGMAVRQRRQAFRDRELATLGEAQQSRSTPSLPREEDPDAAPSWRGRTPRIGHVASAAARTESDCTIRG